MNGYDDVRGNFCGSGDKEKVYFVYLFYAGWLRVLAVLSLLGFLLCSHN